MSTAGISYTRSAEEAFKETLSEKRTSIIHDDHADEDDDDEDEIDYEYKGLFNLPALNDKYREYKREMKLALGEEDEEDEDQDEEEINHGIKETSYGDIDIELVHNDTLYERTLKALFRFVFKLRKHWIKTVTGVSILIFFNLVIILSISKQPSDDIINNVHSFGDIARSIKQLQWQLNDVNEKNKIKLHEFKNYLDLKIENVNNKIYKIDEDLINLKRNEEILLERVEDLNLKDVRVQHDKIPIILDENNNIKVVPEFNKFLQDFIDSKIKGVDFKNEFKIDYKKFVKDYVQEIVQQKIGFLNKNEILSLISSQFQDNKTKLLDEIKSLLSDKNFNTGAISSKLISRAYKQNSKINYSLSSNGARIINYLTSKTFKPKFKSNSIWHKFFKSSENDHAQDKEFADSTSASPFIVLTSNEGYWRSSETVNAKLAIKFLEPIFISDFYYIHEKVVNGALLTSAPHKLSIFISSDKLDEIKAKSEFKDTLDRGSFVKIGEMIYDLNDEETEQRFVIPEYLKQYLVKSIIVQSDENYGNKLFTSFNKFKIFGLTRFDLYSIRQFLQNEEIDQSVRRQVDEILQADFNQQTIHFKNTKNIKRIGQDEVIQPLIS